jgi:hypothetical protein
MKATGGSTTVAAPGHPGAQPERVSPMLQGVPRMLAPHPPDGHGLVAAESQGGAVTPNRRFGSTGNLNFHFLGLVVDGASPYGADGVPVLVEEGAPIE